MKRKQLLSALWVVLVIMCGVALAWTPRASAAGPIQIQLDGRAQISQSRSTQRLILSATSSGGYDLESSLEMAFLQGVTGPVDPSQADQSIGLSGTFTLSDPTGQTMSGQATGTVDSTGTGSLTLADQTGSSQMTANFQVSANGRLQVDLLGLATAGQPSTAAGGQPSVAAASTVDPRTGDPTFWHIARAAGLSAYLMLFLNVFLGLAVHTHYLEGPLARWRSFDLHQFTALLAGGFLALHALALLGDRYMGFTLAQLVVPFASPYRPIWTAMGIVAFYLLLALFGSSYLRRHIGYAAWRAIHYVAFVAFLLTLAHGIFAGTDSGEPWAAALYGGTGAIIALLVALRFRTPVERPAVAARVPVARADRAAAVAGVPAAPAERAGMPAVSPRPAQSDQSRAA